MTNDELLEVARNNKPKDARTIAVCIKLSNEVDAFQKALTYAEGGETNA